MKKLVLSLSTFALFIASIFVFASCEKEENTNSNQNIVKCWEEDDLDDIYISFPNNPDKLIRLRDNMSITTEGPLLEEQPKGRAMWNNDHTSFVCRGTEAVDCGNVIILDNNGNPTGKSGTYAHVYNPDGTAQYTAYNWHDHWQEEF